MKLLKATSYNFYDMLSKCLIAVFFFVILKVIYGFCQTKSQDHSQRLSKEMIPPVVDPTSDSSKSEVIMCERIHGIVITLPVFQIWVEVFFIIFVHNSTVTKTEIYTKRECWTSEVHC